MLIINADDWGLSAAATDAALKYYLARKITSVSAMVFMDDSERAAHLAISGQLDVGLHLNFDEGFTTQPRSATLVEHQARLMKFLRCNKYAQLFYNPLLRKSFYYSYHAQMEEFVRLFGKRPSHIDGHHHMHLCANVVLSHLIPDGSKLRPHFSFSPGQKSYLNIAYRKMVDRWLARRYRLPDFFFDLTQCIEEGKFKMVQALAKVGTVEVMTHPTLEREADYLMSEEFGRMLNGLEIGSYTIM